MIKLSRLLHAIVKVFIKRNKIRSKQLTSDLSVISKKEISIYSLSTGTLSTKSTLTKSNSTIAR